MASSLNPHESSAHIDEEHPGEQAANERPFRSPRLLGTCTCIGLALNIAVAAVALGIQFGFNNGSDAPLSADEFMDGQAPLAGWMAAADAALQLLRILTGILFIAWTYRVHSNLLALGHENLVWKPLAGLVVWFIPLVGLVLPCLVMREIAWRSDARAEEVGTANRMRIVVNWWWGLFLVSPLTFLLPLLFPDAVASLSHESAFRYNVTLYLSVIVSGLLAGWLVLHINGQQEERRRMLQDRVSHPFSRAIETD